MQNFRKYTKAKTKNTLDIENAFEAVSVSSHL